MKPLNKRDNLGQPLYKGSRVMRIDGYSILANILRETDKMIVIEYISGKRKTVYAHQVISIEAIYEKYPELKL